MTKQAALQFTALLLALAIAILVFVTAAQAFDIEYPRFDTSKPREPQVRAWVQKHKPAPSKVITRTVIIEAPKPKPEPRCKPIMSALGDSAKSLEAAQLEAMKAWKASVQFNHGNKFLDPAAVDGIDYQCAPASVPFFGGRIENVVGKILPVQSYVCKVSAAPCEASVSREYGGK
jgi:hypothetical protein